ncbi:MAG: SDR family oxidoreductase [Myxococcales bacterium]|nr:SDR family oxidoreductase [Myxococcales bacterium]MCB9577553.1 SDR family oxidoreductase [Polyangiaceae bacterium]
MSVFRDGILEGKVALITGGGSGIGAGIAKTLARQGARVVLVGRTQEKLEATAAEIDGPSLCVALDVRDYDALAGAVDKTTTELGQLDILVNSAAGNFLAPAAGLSANGFRAVIDIDLVGTFNACRASFQALSRTRGAVLSVTATQAFIPTPLQCHAGAAKAGIEKLTRDLALEWGSVGVRVNAIAPGPIAGTEGMRRLAPPGEDKNALERSMPIGRFGTIDEIAEAALFLLSPAAGFITGTTLLVDGGQSLLGAGPFLKLMEG